MRLSIAAGVATISVSIMLYPLFNGGAWLWGSIGAVLAVFAASWLCGRLSLPTWAAPLMGIAAMVLYLTAAFAGHKAWAIFVPTKDSFVYLGKLFAVGWTDIQRFAAPVPMNRGIALLTTAGVGLIAILIDLFAARMRRAALAGLPMLALATVPATILADPISWPAFILGALGFTNLLIADGRERVGHWGRAVLVRRTRATPSIVRDTADTRGLRLSGKRIGFAAIGLAVLLPAMLPAMEPVSFFTFGVGGSGKGGKGNSISIPNPIANLKGQLDLPEKRTVLTYTASDDVPRYLRIYSLDLFDGEKFDMTQPTGSPENRTDSGPLPWPNGLSQTTPLTNATTTIKISEEISKLSFLPLPYAPRQIEADGDWRADVASLMVFSTREEAAGLEYKVASTEPKATPELLGNLPAPNRQSLDPRYLKLPPVIPPEVKELAFAVTSGSKSNYEAAVKLQEFFTRKGQFKYSLQTRGHGTSALKDFLLSSRAGYCEQFSAAMAVLARVVGIPSRVSIGYTGGTRVNNQWVVGTNDSHAWPELYFEGVGWLPFEPTPAGTIGQGSARVPAYTLPQPEKTGSAAEPTPGSTSDSSGAITGPDGSRPNQRQIEDREGRLLGLDGLPIEEPTPLIAKIGMGVGGLLVLLLIPSAIRLVTRSRRVRALGWKLAKPSEDVTGELVARAAQGLANPSVAAAWAELDDVLCDYGMARQTSETPRALGRRLTEQYEFDAESGAAIASITSAVERTLFARDPGEIEPLKKDLRRVRQALASAVSRRTRVRAVLMPPSTLLRLRRLGEGLLDSFDRLDNIRFRFGRTAQKNS